MSSSNTIDKTLVNDSDHFQKSLSGEGMMRSLTPATMTTTSSRNESTNLTESNNTSTHNTVASSPACTSPRDISSPPPIPKRKENMKLSKPNPKATQKSFDNDKKSTQSSFDQASALFSNANTPVNSAVQSPTLSRSQVAAAHAHKDNNNHNSLDSNDLTSSEMKPSNAISHNQSESTASSSSMPNSPNLPRKETSVIQASPLSTQVKVIDVNSTLLSETLTDSDLPNSDQSPRAASPLPVARHAIGTLPKCLTIEVDSFAAPPYQQSRRTSKINDSMTVSNTTTSSTDTDAGTDPHADVVSPQLVSSNRKTSLDFVREDLEKKKAKL